MAGSRVLIGIVARVVFWAGAALIVYEAVTTLWHHGQHVLAVLSAALFPITLLVWPWKHTALGHPLWMVFAVMMIAYPVSTFIGGLQSIDQPGDW